MNHVRIAAVTLLAVLLAACGASDAGPTGQTPTPEPGGGEPLRVTVAPFLGFGPLHIAREQGLFEQFGVEVEFVEMQTSTDSIPLLLGGDLDVWYGTVVPSLINVIAAGEPTRLVATGTIFDPDGCDYAGVTVPPATVESRDLSTAEGWRGLRLGSLDQSLTTERYIAVLKDRLGLDTGEIETVYVERAATLGALSQGDVDAAITYEPWTTQARLDQQTTVVQPMHEVLADEPSAVMAFGPRLLDDDRDRGARFMAAWMAGIEAFNEGPTDRNVEIMTEATQLEPELLREMCWPTLRADARPSEEAVTEILEFGVELDYVDAVPSADELWDHGFVEQADREVPSASSSPS